MINTFSINFSGGIISPGDLFNILVAASKVNVRFVRFGLRQQLLLDMDAYKVPLFAEELNLLQLVYEINQVKHPNIISSYPAEDIFITKTWLSEGVYKDILDTIDFRPVLKVNLCNSNQSFTPMITGNINWVASITSEHYWHLIIRFPKTNIIYEWDQLCYTNDIARVTKAVEQIIVACPAKFIDNVNAKGEEVFKLLQSEKYIIKTAEAPVKFIDFNLPYYEGLNKINNKYWLGIYRRDELFTVSFLKKLCQLCLDTKVGQICCTSWKSIIIKGIDEKDKKKWNLLLEEFRINMRHAANELNFQVEDNCSEGLNLKNYLVKHLSEDDTRTFGICFGIKTRKKSEVFSSILIRRRYLINIWGFKLFSVYDILCAKNFNPHERTGEVFSHGNLKFLLPEELRRAIVQFYNYRAGAAKANLSIVKSTLQVAENKSEVYFFQCSQCLSIYDEQIGEPEAKIEAGTLFKNLPETYACPVCEANKAQFKKIEKSALVLQIL